MSSASADLHVEEPAYELPPYEPQHRQQAEDDALVPEELVCEVCLGIINEPRKLNCAHSFCRACLHRLLVRIRRRSRSILSPVQGDPESETGSADNEEVASPEHGVVTYDCPTCGETTTVPGGDVDKLSTSAALSRLLEVSGAGWTDTVREEMRQTIRRQRASAAHVSASNGELSSCSEHRSVQEFYCVQCKELVCGHCMLSMHKDHIDLVKSAQEAEDRMTTGLRALMQPSQEAVFAAGEVTGLIGELKKGVVKESTITTNHIKQFFNQARDLLQERESELISRVESESMKIISDFTKKDEVVRRNLGLLSRYVDQVRTTLQQPSDVALLGNTHGLIPTVEYIHKQIGSISLELACAHEEQMPSLCFEGTAIDFSNLGSLTGKVEASGEGGYVLIQASPLRTSTSSLATVHEEAGRRNRLSSTTLHEEGSSSGRRNRSSSTTEPIYEEPMAMASYSRRGPKLPPRVSLTRRSAGSIKKKVEVTVKHVISCDAQASNMRPCGVSVGETDAVIVSDIHSHCVKVLSRSGKVMDIIVGPQSSEQILGPVCLVTDRENQLYILDMEGKKALYRFKNGNFDGAFTSKLQKSYKLNQPWGVAVSDEFIYVTDWQKSCIHIFQSNGKYKDVLHCGQQTTAVLKHPAGIALMSDGSLVVADHQSHCLWRVVHTKDVVEFQQIGSENVLDSPYGVAVTREGFIVVTDTGSSCVCLFSSSGTFLTYLGKRGSERGEFQTPRHVCATEGGEILVADEGNQRIQVFELSTGN